MGTLKLPKSMQKTVVGALKDAMNIVETYVDDNGEPVEASLSEIASALIIEEAMPFDKDLGKRTLGNYRILKDILDVTTEPEKETNTLEAVLDRLVTNLSERKNIHLIEKSENAIDVEIMNE